VLTLEDVINPRPSICIDEDTVPAGRLASPNPEAAIEADKKVEFIKDAVEASVEESTIPSILLPSI